MRSSRILLSTLAVLGLAATACSSDSKAVTTTTAPSTTSATSASATTGSPTSTASSPTTAPAPTATSSTGAASTTGSTATVTGDVTVFAAASLTAAYTDIGKAFEADHPGARVKLNFGASSDLVTQINQGAPTDVFASADQANMKKLTDAAGNDGTPAVFATNSLQIIVEPGNPKGITGVADLAKAGVLYVTCAPAVPIGKYAAQVLTTAGVNVTPASLEVDVKGIVTKVTLGEADAGIVYRTDVIAAGAKAHGVDIPANINVTATYPVVAVKGAPNSAGAHAFEAFVLSAAGRQILTKYGFTAP